MRSGGPTRPEGKSGEKNFLDITVQPGSKNISNSEAWELFRKNATVDDILKALRSYNYYDVMQIEGKQNFYDHKKWKALEDKKNDDERMLYMEVEFLAEHILWTALAFGIVLGQMIEITDKRGIEAIKNIIKEKGLVPYLPRERPA